MGGSVNQIVIADANEPQSGKLFLPDINILFLSTVGNGKIIQIYLSVLIVRQ